MTALILSAVSAVISVAIGYYVSWYRMRAQPFISLLFPTVTIDLNEQFALAEHGVSPSQTASLDFDALSDLTSDAWILPKTDFYKTTAGEVANLLSNCSDWESYGSYLDEDVRRWIDRLESVKKLDSKVIQNVLIESLNHEKFSYLLAEATLRGRLTFSSKKAVGERKVGVQFSDQVMNGSFVFDFDDALAVIGANSNDNPFAEARMAPLVQAIATLDQGEIIKIYKQVPSLFWHQQNLVTRFRELIEKAFNERKRWLIHFSISNLGQPMLVYKKGTLIVDGGGVTRTELPCTIWDAEKSADSFEFEYRRSGGEAVLLRQGEIIDLAAVSRPFGKIKNVETMTGAFESKPGPGSAQVQLRLRARGPERLRPREATSGAINFASGTS